MKIVFKYNYAYLIRNDGKVFEFKGWHPYIKQFADDDNLFSLKCLMTEYPEYLKWLYDNTQYKDTQDSIVRLVKSFLATSVGDPLGKALYDININSIN